MRAIKSIKIHPAIGIARLGNSPTGFFVGPEVPGVHHLGGEPAGFAEHDVEVIVAEILVKPVGPRFGEPRGVLEGEDDVLDRRPVGHDFRVSPAQAHFSGLRIPPIGRDAPGAAGRPATKACAL